MVSSRISTNKFLNFDGQTFSYSNESSGLLDIDFNFICSLCGRDFSFDNSKYKAILQSYSKTKIDTSAIDEYKLLGDFTESILKNKLMRCHEFVVNQKDDVLSKSIEYFKKYGSKQYELLRGIEKNIIYTSGGKINLKFKDTRTGRLSCEGPLNVFTMKHEDREKIIAKKGYTLVHLDFIACQVRVFLFLVKNELYKAIDPYNEIAKIIGINRSIAKEACIKSLFGVSKKIIKEKVGDKWKIIYDTFNKKLYDGKEETINNFFGRPLELKSNKQNTVNNNILQCTERDILMNSAYNINNFIKTNKIDGYIMFPFHDALILMVRDEDLVKNINPLIETFENTPDFCRMFCKVKVGKNFGKMREL